MSTSRKLPTSEAPLRFAIAGLGQHADVLATAIVGADGARLVAGASRSADRAAEFGRQHGVDACESYDALLARDDVDVLIVATPNHLHKDITVNALESGIHVLCEKPLALTESDAIAMVQSAKRFGRLLFVGYYLRFLDVVTIMRTSVVKGEIGIPLDIRAQRYSQHAVAQLRPWRRDLDQAGAGVLCDVAVHLVDLVSYVTGEDVVSVHATARPARRHNVPDDHVVLVLGFRGGGIATITAARGVAGGENDVHIHGSQGALCSGPLRWVDVHKLTVSADGGSRTLSVESGHPYAREIEGVVAAVRGGPSNVATGMDGLVGVRILQAAVRSLESGSTVPVASFDSRCAL